MASVERTPLSEPLLTADEVAALLRVPRSTVYELTRTRFVRIDLDAWVASQRVTPRQ
jgi:predicted DNA-binding transcriptional regulator AlpA